MLYAEDSVVDGDLTTSHFNARAPQLDLEVVDSGQQCLARLAAAAYDVLLLDNRLPDMDAVDVLKQLAEQGPPLPVVVVTAAGDEALVVQLLRLGAWDYVAKEGDYIERLPDILRNAWNVPFYFGGTSLLIVVVVVMDFTAQVQAHLVSHQYGSLLKKSNLRGR